MAAKVDIERQIRTAVNSAMKSTLQRTAFLLQGYIGQEFGERQGNPSERNTTDKLRVITGRLFRSYTPKNANNIFEIESRDGRAVMRFGSKLPYAAIHEEGGTISQSIHITAKMRKFFWARYYETQQDKWKAFALTKRDTINRRITIPARPTLTPAVERLTAEGFAKMQKIFRQELMEALNA